MEIILNLYLWKIYLKKYWVLGLEIDLQIYWVMLDGNHLNSLMGWVGWYI